MNNGIKSKQTYIFLKKKLIFTIKLNITLKSHETFINQNNKKQKIEEQIKKIIKTRETIKQKKTEEEKKNRETIQQSQFGFKIPKMP